MSKYSELSDKIWEYAETGFEEVQSCAAMVEFLKREGFEVEENVDGMATAYIATCGHGKPVIGLLGEYDALSGLNQCADTAERKPVTSGEDNGHGCGHHLLGVGSIKAAVLLKQYLEENHLEGTVKLFGCPAEETGSSKAYLARDGVMKGVDLALSWHPGTINQISSGSSQTCVSVFYKFHGISSHASATPHLGRSALDACELMNVGVNYMREHMEPSDRVHYAYTNVGGKAPNVVQSEATLKYFIRSSTNPKTVKLVERVNNIAKGAALMTDTTLEIVFDEGLSNVVVNETIEKVLADSFRKCYNLTYTPEELQYAQRFKDTLRPEELADELWDTHTIDKDRLRDNVNHRPMNDYFVEKTHNDDTTMGSTDVGDISWVVPTGQFNTACYCIGTGGHSWQMVAQGKSSIAHKGMELAGEILFDAAKTFLHQPQLIEDAWKEFETRLGGETYHSLIPDDIKPHISSAE
ncbi:MAG: amidohydrolase [Erysipelotrichaceae bacterium]|nr:amidohydrolase [Erysipelotrichaceae bacterium]